MLNDRFVNEMVSCYIWRRSDGGIGNFDTIVNLENDGADIKANVKNYRLRDSQYYMMEAITWTEISSSIFTCRYVPKGILFGNGGPVSFFFNKKLMYHLALLNSKIVNGNIRIFSTDN